MGKARTGKRLPPLSVGCSELSGSAGGSGSMGITYGDLRFVARVLTTDDADEDGRKFNDRNRPALRDTNV
jgi:hypothetical protein